MKTRRLVLVLSLVLLLLGGAGFAAWQFALRQLQQAVLQALGPNSSLEQLELGWTAVELRGLRLRAAAGWPAEDELRAERVRVRPDWHSLFGGLRQGDWRLQSIDVDGAYLSLRRGADGKLQLLPSLLRRPAAATAATSPAAAGLSIDRVRLQRGTVELYDASVRQPPHRVRLQALQATLGPLHLPQAVQPLQIQLQAQLKGPQRDGRLTLDGWLQPTTQDADLQARALGVDLVALQPYLLKLNEGGVRRGTLDLALHAQVRQQHLHAPGKLTLTGLELAEGEGALSRFAGVPRQAVLAALARDGRIELRFTLDGRLDDPGFSINDSLVKRVAGGLAESLGVSLSGVVEGVGKVFKGLLGK